MNRRTFLGFFPSIPLAGASSSQSGNTLEKGRARLRIGAGGQISALSFDRIELVNPRVPNAAPKITAGRQELVCDRPASIRMQDGKLTAEYRFDGLMFTRTYELEETTGGAPAAVLKQTLRIEFNEQPRPFSFDLPLNIQLPSERRSIFLPMKNGIGRCKPVLGLDNDDELAYRFAGGFRGGKAQLLAIPMVDEYAPGTDLHLSFITDPLFTSYLRLPYNDQAGRFHFLTGPTSAAVFERTFAVAIHRGDFRRSINLFYAAALPDVQKAADWVHDIAMVDYDYLSKNGRGWFADIDTLTEAVAAADRGKVFLALHGWYDALGRYCYDPRSHSLDKKWTAFSRARHPQVQAFGTEDAGDGMRWPKKSVEAMQPVEMTLGDMHRRIQYARKRGFRVGLYFADGLTAGDDVKETYDPSKVLRWGGWSGPDTKGRSYIQNPLHPAVREHFKGYIQALLGEYGKEVDGFIWDETFTVRANDLGSKELPGYADQAMMTLIKDIASQVASYDPNLVFMASDDIGMKYETNVPPYALVAHGTYQDSHCRPDAWPYGLFPNSRNVLWSCNWAPVTNFRFSKYGAETFDTPVAISNGAFGDDLGVSDMNPAQLRQILDLFEQRKKRRMEIGWIEEHAGEFTYQGRPVVYKYSL